MYLTKRIAEQLCKCRDKIPLILEAQQRPQGLGLRSDQRPPRTTVETWQVVSKCLNYLCDQWTQAPDSDKPSSEFCGREPKTALNTLIKALEREEQRQEGTDPVRYEREHAHKPIKPYPPESKDYNTQKELAKLRREYDVYHETTDLRRRARLFQQWRLGIIRDWEDPPEVDAYCALLALQEYTVNRQWGTAEGFGEILSEKHLKETEENFTRYIRPIWETQKIVLSPTTTQVRFKSSAASVSQKTRQAVGGVACDDPCESPPPYQEHIGDRTEDVLKEAKKSD